tara:strand:+ start:83 stop:508 length:426 start_codon:yes stop_codon:yes gene_type:complete
MSKIVATSYSTINKDILWEQRILFHDAAKNVHQFTIKIHRKASMIEMMNKIQRLIITNFRMVKLCFGEDIGQNIIKFLPHTEIITPLNNFYTYTEKFDRENVKLFKTRTILNNEKLLYQVIKEHRHHENALTLRLRAHPYY